MKKSIFKKDTNTGEIYLSGIVEYYLKQQALYKDYADFEQEYVKRFLQTTSASVQSNFSAYRSNFRLF
jgi:hypothetical protein